VRGSKSIAKPTAKTGKKANGPKSARILLVEDSTGDVFLIEKALTGRDIRYELIRLASRT